MRSRVFLYTISYLLMTLIVVFTQFEIMCTVGFSLLTGEFIYLQYEKEI